MLEICLYLSNLKIYEAVVYLSIRYKNNLNTVSSLYLILNQTKVCDDHHTKLHLSGLIHLIMKTKVTYKSKNRFKTSKHSVLKLVYINSYLPLLVSSHSKLFKSKL